MSLAHCRTLARSFSRRGALATISRRRFADEAGGGEGKSQPYRPWPLDEYFNPRAAKYWSKTYTPTSEESDEYPKEELYLDEIEERLRKYDSKYANSDEYNRLLNEFGWEETTDRAFPKYGSALGDNLSHGRGKKIDPSHYINSEFSGVHRNPVPPVEFMTPEQVRRSRGSLAGFRELPAESPSIWKQWNAYSTLGVTFMLLATKEYFLIGGHDTLEAVLLWGIWGCLGAIIADWMAWWAALCWQEEYDMQFFNLTRRLDHVRDVMRRLGTKPDQYITLTKLYSYRGALSEQVLQRTLQNRVGRSVNNTLTKLKSKATEEAAIRTSAEKGWQKQALEGTLDTLADSRTKEQFTREALAQFVAGDTAKLGNTSVKITSALFKDTYDSNFTGAKDSYMREQRERGTLPWVFKDETERSAARMSTEEKTSLLQTRISEWARGRNPVSLSGVPLS